MDGGVMVFQFPIDICAAPACNLLVDISSSLGARANAERAQKTIHDGNTDCDLHHIILCGSRKGGGGGGGGEV
eukprot:scaffold13228_cov45-Cyclotella_meneghiniana.AAC.2